MSEYLEGPDTTCQYCEYSTTGRNPNERACFKVSGFRVVLLGPRFVKCTDTCKKFVLDKKYGGRGR